VLEVKRDLFYFFNHILIGFQSPKKHTDKERTEDYKRSNAINTDAANFFEIMYELHFNYNLQLLIQSAFVATYPKG